MTGGEQKKLAAISLGGRTFSFSSCLLQQQVVTHSSLGLSMSQTLKKRFPNREGGDIGVSMVLMTNDEDYVDKRGTAQALEPGEHFY